jgi:GAF domain-containing protein
VKRSRGFRPPGNGAKESASRASPTSLQRRASSTNPMTDHRLDDPDRLAALDATELLDRDPGPVFARVARLACRLLNTPTAVVSLVDDRRQVILGQVGVGSDGAPVTEVPIAQSVCASVVRGGEALVVEDLREHPELREVTALAGAGAVAYAGVPIATVDGHFVGVVCVVDGEPRPWSERDVATLHDLAALAATEVELRVARRTQRELADTARTAAVLERYRLLSQEGRDIILFLRAWSRPTRPRSSPTATAATSCSSSASPTCAPPRPCTP